MIFKLFSISTLVLTTSLVSAQMSETKVESEIEAVTVFLRGAQINRISDVSLKSGLNRVVFENLSPFINANSIQVDGFKGMTIVSVNHTTNYLNNDTDKDFERLLNRRNDLVFDREKVRNRIRNLKKEKAFIFANQNLKSAENGVGVEDIMDMSEFYQERLPDINNRLKEYTAQESAFSEDINALNKQLIEIDDRNSKSRGMIEVIVKAERALTGKMAFNFVVRNAGWYPTYDIRSAQLGENINLTYKAMVYQKTGSDWKNVALSLSTGDPNKGSTPPDPDPWRIQYQYAQNKKNLAYQQNQTYQWNSYDFENEPTSINVQIQSEIGDTAYNVNPSNAYNVAPIQFDPYGSPIYDAKDLDAYGNPILKSKSYQEILSPAPLIDISTGTYAVETVNGNSISDVTKMQETSVNTLFEIEIPYSIPSDGEAYSVEVRNYSVPSVYEYYTAPRSDQDAFLVAKAGDWGTMNILPGNSSIYFQNTYVGDAFINPNITDDTLELSLGRDKNVVVERNMIKDYSKKVSVGSKKKVTRGYEIKIRNNRSKAVRLSFG